MKVKTWVEFDQEVTVEVSIAEMMSAITELSEDDQAGMVLDCINRVWRCLSGISPERIAAMNDKQRATIGNALAEQAARYVEVLT